MWYRNMIQKVAKEHDLDWRLVEAIIHVESRGRADAFRFEPKFWARYLSKLPQYEEANPRRVSSSYGLMQIMYTTAVERGFEGDPEALFIPEINLQWGCIHLKYLIQWAQGFDGVTPARQLEAAIASWNGGRGGNSPTTSLLRNGQYARKVAAAYANIEHPAEIRRPL